MIPLNRSALVPILLLATLGLLVGCSKTPSWFVGSFEFDAETSMKPLLDSVKEDKKPAVKEGGGMPGLFQGIATLMVPLAFAQEFSGATITITNDEIITTRGGSGVVKQFEVYEVPDKDTLVLKTSENKIETWKRTKTGIAQNATGDMELLVHFKRKSS
jgi:hypothetical protein